MPCGGGAEEPQAARAGNRGGGGRGGSEERASALAEATSTLARGGLGRSPRALASGRDRRPSPTRPARSLSLTRRRLRRRLRPRPPKPRGPAAAAERVSESLGARSRRLAGPPASVAAAASSLASSGAAAGFDCATRTPPGQRCTSARPSASARNHENRWALWEP